MVSEGVIYPAWCGVVRGSCLFVLRAQAMGLCSSRLQGISRFRSAVDESKEEIEIENRERFREADYCTTEPR